MYNFTNVCPPIIFPLLQNFNLYDPLILGVKDTRTEDKPAKEEDGSLILVTVTEGSS